MSHDYHDGPDDAVLFDNCEECDARAANPLNGLMNLDNVNWARLWDRVQAVEREHRGAYLTRNEARLGGAMNKVRVLIERHSLGGIDMEAVRRLEDFARGDDPGVA